jgi:small subunit ribosomal protein S2
MSKNPISVEGMMEAGLHFGHQTFRRNPKMDKYIFEARSGVHIIDLTRTEPLLKAALEFAAKTVAEGKQIVFVGTKRQASKIVSEHAAKCGQPYVADRWLGGLLTNFETVRGRLKYMRELDEKYAKNDFSDITKKEKVLVDREYEKLQIALGGLRELKGLPGALFVVDILRDQIAVKEAQKLGIPVIAIVDTNVNPDSVDYPIPGNDDARKAIEFVVAAMAEACNADKSEIRNMKSEKGTEDKAEEVKVEDVKMEEETTDGN